MKTKMKAKIRGNSKNKMRTVESSHWTWDMVAIAVALFLGFGPYVLISLFENLHPQALVSQKDNTTARIPASEENQ